mmetsp:Transcript_17017/g.19582  ORF Transcript_17017/g.19582 Transcript_17017/m.19582 type:complete len:133 (-) Transcript_17017:62-460(-)
MAYVRSEGKPVNLIMLSKKALFWDHPVKRNNKGWGKKWRNEINRARTVLLPQNSTTPEEVEEFFSKTSAFRAKRKIDEERLAAEHDVVGEKTISRIILLTVRYIFLALSGDDQPQRSSSFFEKRNWKKTAIE